MKLVDMKAMEIAFLFEITYTDLCKLKLILDNTQVILDLKDPVHAEADAYLHKVFYPNIVKAMEGASDA